MFMEKPKHIGLLTPDSFFLNFNPNKSGFNQNLFILSYVNLYLNEVMTRAHRERIFHYYIKIPKRWNILNISHTSIIWTFSVIEDKYYVNFDWFRIHSKFLSHWALHGWLEHRKIVLKLLESFEQICSCIFHTEKLNYWEWFLIIFVINFFLACLCSKE